MTGDLGLKFMPVGSDMRPELLGHQVSAFFTFAPCFRVGVGEGTGSAQSTADFGRRTYVGFDTTEEARGELRHQAVLQHDHKEGK